MYCSFSSSVSNAKPLVSHARSHKPQGKLVVNITAFSCRNIISDESSNFYKVLSLNSNQASVDEVKKAYRIMARQYHPDVCDPSRKEESTRMFVQLHEAYKTLSDPVLREEYDCRLSSRNFQGKNIRADDFTGRCSRNRWREQIQELKRRSNCRETQKEASCGSRMRAKTNSQS